MDKRIFDAIQAETDLEFLQDTYVTILGRLPDDDGLQFYIKKLKYGNSRISIWKEISQSKEAKSRTENQFTHNTNRKKNKIIDTIKRIRWITNNQIKAKADDIEAHLNYLENFSEKAARAISGELEKLRNSTNLVHLPPTALIGAENDCSKNDAEIILESQLFDIEYYKSKSPELPQDPYEIAWHYINEGEKTGLQPNRFFDPIWYKKEHRIESHNSLLHYIKIGSNCDIQPSPYFNKNYYLSQHPDVARSNIDPFIHFVNYGSSEGRRGSPVAISSYQHLGPEEIRCFLGTQSAYEAWINVNRNSARSTIEAAHIVSDTKAESVKVSIITPAFNSDPRHFLELSASILNQRHTNWEWCIANDASTRVESINIFNALSRTDKRIRLTNCKKNGGISLATNEAVRSATGEILAFVDHDDLIATNCVAEIASFYKKNPGVDLAYSNDDKIDNLGRRYAPQFKPSWCPTLLLSYMYFGHILSVKRSLFLDLGGFRKEFDGAQDYDFALRAVEKSRSVGHIDKILYHWRAIPGSTAHSGAEKPASFDAGRRAVEEALRRRQIRGAKVIHPEWAISGRAGMFEIIFPNKGPSVTIIIPTKDKPDLLRKCIESLEKTTYKNYSVLVIDNQSTEQDTKDYLRAVSQRKGFRVAQMENKEKKFSYANLMNRAALLVESDFILFLNNDTSIISPAWLGQMMGYAQMPKVGSVGAKLLFGDGTIQHAGIIHGLHNGLAGHAFKGSQPHDWGYLGFIRASREYSAVTAACMLTPRALFLSMGGFDERRFPVAYNDVDYGIRLSLAGYKNVYCSTAELFHFEGKTRGFIDNPKEIASYRERYRNHIDEFYSRHLSLEDESFNIKPTPDSTCTSRLPITIVAVSHNLNLEGASLVLFDLLFAIRNYNFSIIVYSTSSGPLLSRYKSAGISVKFLGDPQAGTAELSQYEKNIDFWSQKFLEEGADIVIANTLGSFWAVNAAHRAKIPSIFCQHESEAYETYFDYLCREIRGFAYAAFAQAYRVTYVANATLERWRPLESRNNFCLIRHALTPEYLSSSSLRADRTQARLALEIPETDFVICSVGTICRRKNQEDLIKAIARISAKEGKHTRTFVVGAIGEPSYMAKIEELIHRNSVSESITFTGPKDGAELYYRAADVYVCNSRIESAPRVLLEAMAYRLPVITTPVFGIPEMVRNGVNALFYNPGDDETLAMLIESIRDDKNLREALSEGSGDALDSLPNFGDFVSGYLKIITEATQSSTPFF